MKDTAGNASGGIFSNGELAVLCQREHRYHLSAISNKALTFSIPSNNARAVYYLRGLCNFLVNNKKAGITDMKQAGEDGIKFLEEQGIVEKPSEPQRKTTQSGSSSKRANTTPILKKTK